MKFSFLKTALILAPFLLSACDSRPVPRGAVARLAPETAEAVHSYRYNECSGSISGHEQAGIRKFLGGLHLDQDDVIIVTLPKGRNATRDVQRRRTMERLLFATPAQVRILAERDFRDSCRSESDGILRVVRTLSVGAACPDGDLATGCSNGRNLANMIAYPSDTYLPRQTEPLQGSGIYQGEGS